MFSIQEKNKLFNNFGVFLIEIHPFFPYCGPMGAIVPDPDDFSGPSGDFPDPSGDFPALSAKTGAQAEMLANRLRKRHRHLKKWARRTGAGVYRLYDRDIPEIPLILDWYSGQEGAPFTEGPKNNDAFPGGAVAGALYKRPYEKNEKEEAIWLEAMKEAAANALYINPEAIFLRERKKQSHSQSGGQYERLTEKALWREICEYGLRYRVNLSGYLDTGIFPDRRLLRALLRKEAAGKRFLNLFCYTGALSVAAAAGGAASVDSVDLSNTYLDWAKDNFSLNGMKAVVQSPEDCFTETKPQAKAVPFSLIRADVLRFVEEARRRPLRWDTIILDPPAFSNSKKMISDFDLKRDHSALIASCLSLLSPGGVLYLSANVKGFSLDTEGLRAGVRRDIQINDITEQLRDEDFKGRRIPATWRIRTP